MKRLLIVDDEVKICSLLSRFFEDRGFSTRVAHSGREALATLQTDVPDHVLLDIRMPGMSGIEVLRAAKQRYPHLHVVMVTASDNEQMAKAALELGAADYFTKPFRLDDRKWTETFFVEEPASWNTSPRGSWRNRNSIVPSGRCLTALET